MASETEYSNYQTIAAYVAANISPYFRAKTIMPNLMAAFNFQSGSDSIKLRKAGSVTATTATESTAHAKSEYTETSPNTLLAAESKVYTELSLKALKFANADLDALTAEHARALATKFDVDAMALFDALNGGTAIGTSGADVTIAHLIEASYTVRANNAPGQLAYVLHPRQVYDIQAAIVAAAASVWTNPSFVDILGGQPSENGLRGMFFGIPVYESTNTESLNGDADWGGACLDVTQALAYGIAGGIDVFVEPDMAERGLIKLGSSLFYDVKEYNDLAGVSIETDK